MSKPEIDSDGFQIVSSKKSYKKNTLVPRKEQKFRKNEIKIDTEKSYRRIQSAVDELEGSEYLKSTIKAVSNVLKHKTIIEIVCFGLGHIGECNVSRYQLAFLLCLKNCFKPQKVSVHDPIFYTDECELIKKFNLTLIEENTEGTYIITNKGISLVYLPHCPKQLTNNFLWSNWGLNLENCILLGNSFTSIIDSNSDRILAETVPFINRIHPITYEVSLDNNFTYKDIFNDTSIHYFSKEKLESLSSDFWMYKNKPQYIDTVEFITSLMVDKLTV
ncbi:SRR1-like protein [Maniola hyperantus]|uniref:SRR1-like protein n=1 Tax=Aphantopus hyperantus TaxID=2795564 RepID=UPI0015686073|nr:SRR1-like protein [Maniola hyperantus]